jgi:hypothetical protein
MSRPSHPPRLHYADYTWRRVQIMKLFLMQFSPFYCHLIPLRAKYPPQHIELLPTRFKLSLFCYILRVQNFAQVLWINLYNFQSCKALFETHCTSTFVICNREGCTVYLYSVFQKELYNCTNTFVKLFLKHTQHTVYLKLPALISMLL